MIQNSDYDIAKRAIQNIFGDLTISRNQAYELLEDLGSIIDCQLMAIDEDRDNEED